ncbi:MAG: nucleoside recognition domain-containing protein [Bacillota bacterium]|jgi:spore maturation protein A
MINTVWLLLFCSGIVTAAITGKIALISTTIFSSTAAAIEFTIGLAGMIAFWSGILKVAEVSGITAGIAKLFRPVLSLLFPTLAGHPAILGVITLTLAANLLGLGNVATPMGLETMARLQTLNPDQETVSPEMTTFLALVLGGLTLLPTTLIALRARAGSTRAAVIMVPVLLVTFWGTMVGLGVNYVASRLVFWRIRKE